MADPQLSTRDLAGTSAVDDTAEQASTDHRDVSGNQTGEEEPLGETKPADQGRNEEDLQASSTEQTVPEPAPAATFRDEGEPLLPDDQS